MPQQCVLFTIRMLEELRRLMCPRSCRDWSGSRTSRIMYLPQQCVLFTIRMLEELRRLMCPRS
jgi:hypothetical protein